MDLYLGHFFFPQTNLFFSIRSYHPSQDSQHDMVLLWVYLQAYMCFLTFTMLSWNFPCCAAGFIAHSVLSGGFPGASVVKDLPANAGDAGSNPGLGRSTWGGDGDPLQYSCLGNPMDRGAWRAAVHAGWKELDRNEHAHTQHTRFSLPGTLLNASVRFSHSVASDSLRPGGLQHARLPCPSTTPRACHRVGDAIQPSHPLSSPSPPAFNPSQHQGLFQCLSSSHQVAKVLELQLQHQSFQWISRTDFL